ncbi:hypothetical protein PIB30_023271 [Stylosanthes scabra]|uniref:Uncharacterized protein n=1 Tax=Stylosanthes scabra TaxID=79078 RepID=A0ABU6Z7Q0_9FABA|nr:hypothetical protein [Stylosanthes scabra]
MIVLGVVNNSGSSRAAAARGVHPSEKICPSKEENAAVAVRRGRGRPRRPCHSFSPSVQPQPPLTAQGARRSSRRYSFAVIVVTETRRVRKTKKRTEPESLHQRTGSGTQPQDREKGEHPSRASQSRESEIASSSFSPVSGPEGNSLHCLVK